MPANDYPALRAWHYDSKKYYVEMLVEQAREVDAPNDVVYRRKDGSWVRVDELPPSLRRQYKRLL